MDKPNIVEKFSKKITMEKGRKYSWCSCGLSSDQPFCDGSHRGSDFRPVLIEPEETKVYGMCLCKHTKNPKGFCDGTHKEL